MSVEVQDKVEQILVEGFCILRDQFPKPAIEAGNQAFAPILLDYVAEHADNPNRGPARHYIPLPFEPPLYNPCFFDDDTIIAIASQVLGRISRLTNTPATRRSMVRCIRKSMAMWVFSSPKTLIYNTLLPFLR